MPGSMLDDLQGRRILVTGASQGIGAAVATGLGRLGAHVGVHFNTNEAAAEAVVADIRAGGGHALPLGGNVASSAEARDIVERAADGLGGIDTLVNIAGGPVRRVKAEDIDDALFEDVVNLNARAVVVMTNAARPYLRARRGSVVNTLSYAAMTGSALALVYSGAKAFVATTTRSFALDLAADGVRVNAVSPGVVMTPFHRNNSSPEWLETMRNAIPLKRIATAEECVGAYAFLASNAMSGYITGQTIEVNGGLIMPR